MVGKGALSRRRLIAGLLLVPPALAGCSFGAAKEAAPDPLVALADGARADAALAAAAAAADPQLAGRVATLRTARTAHAAALDAEIVRLDPTRASATPLPAVTSAPAGGVTLTTLRDAIAASGEAAAAAALTLPAARVGLVASVAACCATYAAVLV